MISTRTREALLRFAFWSTFVVSILLLIIAPLATSFLIRQGGYSSSLAKGLRALEQCQGWMLLGLTLGWLFVVGSCLASFLNVVAWRVPRGKRITGSSHCPTCDCRLKFRDKPANRRLVANAGRCSICQTAIPVRYLVAEIVLGSIFLLLGSVAFLTGGANWPLFDVPSIVGIEHLLFSPDWQLIRILAWHLVLVCFLFTVMLIESDRLPIPKSILGTALFLVCVVAYFWPATWLVPWNYNWLPSPPAELPTRTVLVNIVAGLLSGAGVGWLIGFATGSPHENSSAATYCLILVGVFLGWQATLSVGTLTLVSYFALQAARGFSILAQRIPSSASILLATVFHLSIWRFLY